MKTKKNEPLKWRNEFVAAMRFRKSGAHDKTNKAKRRKEKVKFKKEYMDQ